jgi:23S rRNA (guanosine2251-2'-O)-methyltransferase
MRCPVCMGDTRILLSRELIVEPARDRPDSLPHEATKSNLKNLYVLLDNIRSAWNVGSILRSADGFGFAHVYLCGITPTPDGPAREAVTKTSLGAEDSVPWSYHKDSVKLVKGLKKEGWWILAMEEDHRSVPISKYKNSQFPGHAVLIVGNEVTGVDPELLNLCDDIFYIPMRGEKKSFNVAIAFGIAAYASTLR